MNVTTDDVEESRTDLPVLALTVTACAALAVSPWLTKVFRTHEGDITIRDLRPAFLKMPKRSLSAFISRTCEPIPFEAPRPKSALHRFSTDVLRASCLYLSAAMGLVAAACSWYARQADDEEYRTVSQLAALRAVHEMILVPTCLLLALQVFVLGQRRRQARALLAAYEAKLADLGLALRRVLPEDEGVAGLEVRWALHRLLCVLHLLVRGDARRMIARGLRPSDLEASGLMPRAEAERLLAEPEPEAAVLRNIGHLVHQVVHGWGDAGMPLAQSAIVALAGLRRVSTALTAARGGKPTPFGLALVLRLAVDLTVVLLPPAFAHAHFAGAGPGADMPDGAGTGTYVVPVLCSVASTCLFQGALRLTLALEELPEMTPLIHGVYACETDMALLVAEQRLFNVLAGMPPSGAPDTQRQRMPEDLGWFGGAEEFPSQPVPNPGPKVGREGAGLYAAVRELGPKPAAVQELEPNSMRWDAESNHSNTPHRSSATKHRGPGGHASYQDDRRDGHLNERRVEERREERQDGGRGELNERGERQGTKGPRLHPRTLESPPSPGELRLADSPSRRLRESFESGPRDPRAQQRQDEWFEEEREDADLFEKLYKTTPFGSLDAEMTKPVEGGDQLAHPRETKPEMQQQPRHYMPPPMERVPNPVGVYAASMIAMEPEGYGGRDGFGDSHPRAYYEPSEGESAISIYSEDLTLSQAGRDESEFGDWPPLPGEHGLSQMGRTPAYDSGEIAGDNFSRATSEVDSQGFRPVPEGFEPVADSWQSPEFAIEAAALQHQEEAPDEPYADIASEDGMSDISSYWRRQMPPDESQDLAYDPFDPYAYGANAGPYQPYAYPTSPYQAEPFWSPSSSYLYPAESTDSLAGGDPYGFFTSESSYPEPSYRDPSYREPSYREPSYRSSSDRPPLPSAPRHAGGGQPLTFHQRHELHSLASFVTRSRAQVHLSAKSFARLVQVTQTQRQHTEQVFESVNLIQGRRRASDTWRGNQRIVAELMNRLRDEETLASELKAELGAADVHAARMAHARAPGGRRGPGPRPRRARSRTSSGASSGASTPRGDPRGTPSRAPTAGRLRPQRGGTPASPAPASETTLAIRTSDERPRPEPPKPPRRGKPAQAGAAEPEPHDGIRAPGTVQAMMPHQKDPLPTNNHLIAIKARNDEEHEKEQVKDLHKALNADVPRPTREGRQARHGIERHKQGTRVQHANITDVVACKEKEEGRSKK